MLVLPVLFLVLNSRVTVQSNAVCKAGFPQPTRDPLATTVSTATICLPSPTNMITVLGTPDPSSVPFKKSTASWDSCVSSCSTDTSCLMVAQSTDTLNCVVYNYGDVWRVQEGGTGNVSIKVNKQMDKCFETVQELFTSENTFNSVAASVYNTYNILADAQNFTFTYNNDTLGLKGCNDFLQATPQCSPATCLTTMIPYFASPVPGYYNHVFKNFTTVSWKECMTLCQVEARCFGAQMQDGNSTCTLYNEQGVLFLDKKQEGSGSRFAMKIAFTSSSCSSSATDAVSGKVYKSPPGYVSPFYRIGTSSNYYGLFFYNATTCPNQGIMTNQYMQGWYLAYYSVPMLNITTATDMCMSIGDGLLPFPLGSQDFLLELQINSGRSWATQFANCFPLMWDNLKLFNRKVETRMFIGYRKINNVWTWDLPHLVKDPNFSVWRQLGKANVDYKIWNDAAHPCAVNGFPTTTYGPPTKYVVDSDCKDGDGFYCHLPNYSP